MLSSIPNVDHWYRHTRRSKPAHMERHAERCGRRRQPDALPRRRSWLPDARRATYRDGKGALGRAIAPFVRPCQVALLDRRPPAAAFIRLSMFVRAGRPSTSRGHCNKTIVPVQVYFSVRLGSGGAPRWTTDRADGRATAWPMAGRRSAPSRGAFIGALHSDRVPTKARRAPCRGPGTPPPVAAIRPASRERKSPNPRGREDGAQMARWPGIWFEIGRFGQSARATARDGLTRPPHRSRRHNKPGLRPPQAPVAHSQRRRLAR